MGKAGEREIWDGRGVVQSGGRLRSRWWSSISKLDHESSGYNAGWFNDMVVKEVGTGSNSYFWFDPWLEGGPLHARFARLLSLSLDNLATVSEVVDWEDGQACILEVEVAKGFI